MSAQRVAAALAVIGGLSADEQLAVIVSSLAKASPRLLAAGAVAWFAALDELAKVNPDEAGRLAAAMYAHLAAYRPESPAPLDSGFLPTEPVRTEAP